MNVKKARSGNKLYYVQLAMALLGAAASIYLLIQHTRLKTGIQGSASFCALGKFSDCDVVNASQYSEFLGVPIASLGACFYFLLFLLGLLTPPANKDFRKFQRALAWLALAGLIIDAALFGVSLFVLKNLCALCFFTYLATLGHFLCNLAMARQGTRWGWDAIKLALLGREESAPAPIPPVKYAITAVCFLCFALLIGFLPSLIKMQGQSYSLVDTAIDQFYAQWKDRPQRMIEIKAGDGTYGNPNSKIRIVEFSDFECPHCRKAAFTLHTALKSLGDRVFFVFKNFPLDSTCNPAVTYQLHPNACLFARLAYCAERKKDFWRYHDLIFFLWGEEHRAGDFDTITDTIKGVFTKEEAVQCLKGDSSLHNVQEDIRLATSLDVKATPTVFINGKQVTIPLTVEVLRHLVELEEQIH